MKISLNWLKKYIPFDADPEELADRLTMTGLEVEAIFDRYAWLGEVITARVEEVWQHPESDSLKCCRVNTGEASISLVCGAPNVEKNGKYPCAMPGTKLPGGITVEKRKIRGKVSEGMLCSEAELELGEDSSGLMRLDQDIPEGTPLNRALGLSDTVFEIGLTPNRADCLSFIGIAREAGAILGRSIRVPEINPVKNSGPIDKYTSVTIKNPKLCPRYTAGLITGARIAPSPHWLQNYLISIGLKPINNIVDVTNFVMMETGQPLHAFDFDRLEGQRIVVRTAGPSLKFVTLDGREHSLSNENLMICDSEKPVAVAGVMGGENSEISPSTRRILIESAYFDPVSIRKTAKLLGVSTEASHRFERGVDPEGTVYALERAKQLMAELSGATIIEGIIDEYPEPVRSKEIELDPSAANRLLGTALSADKMQELLESVEFSVKRKDENSLSVTAPSFRVDVERPEDLMEEIARLWGYDRIATTFPRTSTPSRLPERSLELKEEIRDRMCGYGFLETINYSFAAKDSCDRLALPGDDERRRMLEILNPLSEEQAVMRTSLVPGLLEAMHKNLSHQIRDLKLFELGKAYFSRGRDQLPEEVESLAALWSGSRLPLNWKVKPEPCDFYDLKGVAESLLSGLKLENIRFEPLARGACFYLRPGRSAMIKAGSTEIGSIGELHKDVLKSYDLKQTAFLFELNLDRMLPRVPVSASFTPIPKYPAATRDLTLIVDSSLPAGHIVDTVNSMKEPLLENILVFDLYSGAPIPEGKKSISIRLTYRSSAETLADSTVNRIHENITRNLINTCNASLPA